MNDPPARILLLVPHPDDEVVGCAVAIRQAAQRGAKFFGLYLTSGVPAEEAVWRWYRKTLVGRAARRRREAEEAAIKLGITMLGLFAIPSRQLKSHIERVLAAVCDAIAAQSITEVWVPAFEGAHQDHDVANFIAAQTVPFCPVREFAEYNFAGRKQRQNRFPDENGSEEILRLTDQERTWKRDLLALYESEQPNLKHAGCDVESLRPLPRYDYAARPHRGRLFYERFQWVPFRHPRIDFESPERVAEVLSSFSSAS